MSLAASRHSRRLTVLVCHTWDRSRARADTPAQLAEFSLQKFRVSVSKRTSTTIPSNRLIFISPDSAQSEARQKNGIEGHPHPQRTPPISGLCGALI
jgi:hypothetical protein